MAATVEEASIEAAVWKHKGALEEMNSSQPFKCTLALRQELHGYPELTFRESETSVGMREELGRVRVLGSAAQECRDVESGSGTSTNAPRVAFQGDRLAMDSPVCLRSWSDLHDSGSEARRNFVAIFNARGFCVLQSSEEDFSTLDLHSLFGGFVPHAFADARGRVTIDPSVEQCSRNVRDTQAEHQPHTDEAYSCEPGAVITMQCEVAARSGGETILISAKAMYDAAVASLAPEQLEALFSPCLTVGRALPGSEEVQEAVIPIFSQLGDGRVAVRWRSRDAYLVSVTAEADAGYRFLEDFVADPRNRIHLRLQPGQVIIIDNRSLLHGRLPFPVHERRRYIRTNFYNNGSLQSELALGFAA